MSQNITPGIENLAITIFTENQEYRINPRSLKYCYFIEDIFSLCITGKIVFVDSDGIMERGPITGRELVSISYGSKQSSRGILMETLKVNKIEPKKLAKPEESSVIEITLVDEFYKQWHYNKISKGWLGDKISTIIKEISTKYVGIDAGGFELFDPTRERLPHFDTHLRSPAECVQWLMNRGSSSDSKCPGYLLYRASNKDGTFKFNLASIEKLLTNKELMGPKDPKSSIDLIYEFEQANPNYINKIKDFKLTKVDMNALRSLTGGTITGFDINRKLIIDKTYTYKDAVKKFTILGNKSLFPSSIGVNGSRIDIDGYGNEDILDNIWYGNWIREYCHQQLVEIVVSGNCERYCGGLITIKWPSYDKQKLVLNREMGGKYLVKSITNFFGPSVENGWVQKMVLIKNGYQNSSDTTLLKATKVNL